MLRPPSEHVIATFKGVRATARALDLQPSTVSSWRPKGRCGGQIPPKAMKKILRVAKRKNLDITAEDLLLGREVSAPKKIKPRAR